MTNYRKAKKDSCERCGFVPEDACQLDVHHLDHDHLNNDSDNLATLCSNCHALQHRPSSGPRQRYVKCPFCKARLGLSYSVELWKAEHLPAAKHCRVLAEYEAGEKLKRMRYKHDRSIERGTSDADPDVFMTRWGPWFVELLYADLLDLPQPERFCAE